MIEMKKILFLVASIILLLNINVIFAHEHNFNETKQIIDSEVSCDKLTDEQLEFIGEYYMEQMHPGEAHELMDKMMGGDDSESLREMHINMAKMLYCNEDVGGMMSSGGMMGMMSMMGSSGMMGGNMMGGSGMMQMMSGTSGSGMMGSFGNNFGYWNFINIFYIILLIGAIILIILLIVKLWKSIENKKERR